MVCAKRFSTGLATAAGLLVAAAFTAQTAAAKAPAAPVRPLAFNSCASLIQYGRINFIATGGLPEQPLTSVATASGAVTPKSAGATPAAVASAAVAAGSGGASSPAFSTTNDQEPGVDEPDIAKTDGSTIFTVNGNTLYAVSANGGAPRLAGSLALGANGYGAQLLLDGNRLLVISTEAPVPFPIERPVAQSAASTAIVASPYYSGGTTVLTEVDVSDPSAMKVTQTLSVDGHFVDARQNGSTARLVISSAPRGILQPLLRQKVGGWVPSWTFHNALTGSHFTRSVAPCTAIRRPVQFSGLGMVTIVTVDLNRGLAAAQSQALMADAQIVYGSEDSLYLATQKWLDPETPFTQIPTSQSTVIDRFDATDPETTTFVSSGSVPGYLLNQFSLSEYDGYLRAATTSRPIWWNGSSQQTLSQSYVTVLASQGNQLVQVGQVSGLGQGEQIYSVRFVDDIGYVATFQQVDPLYTIDLSTPSAPKVTSQLELAGYSSYLQPLGNGLLLGIGNAVDATTNEPSATQLDLFDVSTPAQPRLIQQLTLGAGSSSEASYDHHALLYWPATSLAVIPAEIYAPTTGATAQPAPFVGAIGFHIDQSGITELGQIVHDQVGGTTPSIERAIVIGPYLFTISTGGVMSSTLTTLAREAFVAFPTVPPVAVPGLVPGSTAHTTG